MAVATRARIPVGTPFLLRHHFQSLIPVGVVGNIRACHARARGSIPRSGAHFIPISLVGQDTRFSSGRPGFKSRMGNFLPQPRQTPRLEAKEGAKGESNPRPLAPKARIIPLDHWPTSLNKKQTPSAGLEPATTGLKVLRSTI